MEHIIISIVFKGGKNGESCYISKWVSLFVRVESVNGTGLAGLTGKSLLFLYK